MPAYLSRAATRAARRVFLALEKWEYAACDDPATSGRSWEECDADTARAAAYFRSVVQNLARRATRTRRTSPKYATAQRGVWAKYTKAQHRARVRKMLAGRGL